MSFSDSPSFRRRRRDEEPDGFFELAFIIIAAILALLLASCSCRGAESAALELPTWDRPEAFRHPSSDLFPQSACMLEGAD